MSYTDDFLQALPVEYTQIETFYGYSGVLQETNADYSYHKADCPQRANTMVGVDLAAYVAGSDGCTVCFDNSFRILCDDVYNTMYTISRANDFQKGIITAVSLRDAAHLLRIPAYTRVFSDIPGMYDWLLEQLPMWRKSFTDLAYDKKIVKEILDYRRIKLSLKEEIGYRVGLTWVPTPECYIVADKSTLGIFPPDVQPLLWMGWFAEYRGTTVFKVPYTLAKAISNMRAWGSEIEVPIISVEDTEHLDTFIALFYADGLSEKDALSTARALA